MKLVEILTQALALAKKQTVTIARPSDERRCQIRFVRDRSPELAAREPRGIRVESRKWLDQRGSIPQASARGTVGPYVGWSRWSTFLGFGIKGVLADDWAIIENEV